MNFRKRAIVVVIDSMGIGALDDCNEFNDNKTCNTLVNTANATGGLNLPNMEKMGLGNLADIKGVSKVEHPIATATICKMKSKGKDTTTGHFELAGLILDKPFKTYEKFPDELINEFIKKTGCKGILGNYPASGTKIIEDLNDEHQKTKFPIIYTSADSVFQIAVDIDTIPLETLYEWCKIARKILNNGYNVSRVIARPYQIIDGKPTRIGKFRHDYAVPPPHYTILNEVQIQGGSTYAIGKINDIFVHSGISDFIPTGSNDEGLNETIKAIISREYHLIFTNLVDTDMLFGHRRDAIGYKKALEAIDEKVGIMLEKLQENDLFIITADHGCDPTAEGTDHTREMVPVLMYSKSLPARNVKIQESGTYVAAQIRRFLELARIA